MKVLILSSPSDSHAASVHRYLLEMDAQVDFLVMDQFANSHLDFRLRSESRSCWLSSQDQSLDLESYSSIWHRRPSQLAVKPTPVPWVDNMIRQEIIETFNGITHPLRSLWVNHPHRDHACSRKLWQLDVARTVGLSIPDSLVTNQPGAVRNFFEECDGNVIYKLVSELSNHYVPRFEGPGITTFSLSKHDLNYLEQISHCPHLFQRKVEKAADIRVTIVGQRIFAVRIDSQAGKGKTDWRNDYSVEMTATDLPSPLASSCLALMRELRLNYGALDFCEDIEGNYVFIEINNAGQYLWQELRLGLPISMELARLLTHQTPPITENPFA